MALIDECGLVRSGLMSPLFLFGRISTDGKCYSRSSMLPYRLLDSTVRNPSPLHFSRLHYPLVGSTPTTKDCSVIAICISATRSCKPVAPPRRLSQVSRSACLRLFGSSIHLLLKRTRVMLLPQNFRVVVTDHLPALLSIFLYSPLFLFVYGVSLTAGHRHPCTISNSVTVGSAIKFPTGLGTANSLSPPRRFHLPAPGRPTRKDPYSQIVPRFNRQTLAKTEKQSRRGPASQLTAPTAPTAPTYIHLYAAASPSAKPRSLVSGCVRRHHYRSLHTPCELGPPDPQTPTIYLIANIPSRHPNTDVACQRGQ